MNTVDMVGILSNDAKTARRCVKHFLTAIYNFTWETKQT